MSQILSPTHPEIPKVSGEKLQWGRCSGANMGLAFAEAIKQHEGTTVIVTDGMLQATELQNQIQFFLGSDSDNNPLDHQQRPIISFPDWETLPYDVFSPLPELVSQRLSALHAIQNNKNGILILPITTLMQRILPKVYLNQNSLLLNLGDVIEIDSFRNRLQSAGYLNVSSVMSHGEYAIRGAIIDLFPMGATEPYRIDLFDDEVDSIRVFNPEDQRSGDKQSHIHLLPAKEFPFYGAGIDTFRKNYRNTFEGDLKRSLIYQDVSDGNPPNGIEYYLPLFFDQTETLFDYIQEDALLLFPSNYQEQCEDYFDQISDRFEQRRHDIERPILEPKALYLDKDELARSLKGYRGISYQNNRIASRNKGYKDFGNFENQELPSLAFHAKAAEPAKFLKDFIKTQKRILFVAETTGRRESLLETLRDFSILPSATDNWQTYLESKSALSITVAPIEKGLWLSDPDIALIPEALLLGEQVRQTRRRRKTANDPDQIIRNLTELQIGSPVVHEDHGIGRYLGLQTLSVGTMPQEFLTLEYAKGDKLYVPVASIHLISRYTGAAESTAPIHRLGGEQWDKIKKKAAQRVRDVAAELLDIYARREARQGFKVPEPGDEYIQFKAAFEFEETPDQESAIEAVIEDMTTSKPMDRVICGDVGFGKTEVAMRAAFMAVQGGKQVAILVPTTLLSQQHFQNLQDRFADWPFKVASLSRFNSTKEVNKSIKGLADGTVDIVVGTHKILSESIEFKNLGLVIIDEEHRFGVRHKERLKSLRSEVDILTLTATPIPRTLNMAMSGLRDLSIIATPPAGRNPIKTFINEWDDTMVTEACMREIQRGGQVYVLHNEVKTIEKMTEQLEALLPGARVAFAHGQMREQELEQIMRDFYHHRFNILVATTIIESGIDVPTANTIIINRADKLGLAQLHQLRGRVGRSHHRAYAYLITPNQKSMTADAKKRLDALASLEHLGAGFTLSTHDLEIRGAGELLGDEQSGQIHEIGYTLYTEMLERAVQAIKAGKQPELDRPLDHGTEIDLNIPALLPEDYLPDVHIRLIQYKRIASAVDNGELRELQVELIDRFGLLPDSAKNLFAITSLKLLAQPYGIRKIDAGPQGGRILFSSTPKIDPVQIIQLIQQQPKRFKLDGSDKLRFIEDLSEPDNRADKVGNILKAITGNNK